LWVQLSTGVYNFVLKWTPAAIVCAQFVPASSIGISNGGNNYNLIPTWKICAHYSLWTQLPGLCFVLLGKVGQTIH
jgi:hypothetical protein